MRVHGTAGVFARIIESTENSSDRCEAGSEVVAEHNVAGSEAAGREVFDVLSPSPQCHNESAFGGVTAKLRLTGASMPGLLRKICS